MSDTLNKFEAPKQGAIVWALKDRVLLVNTVWGFSAILVTAVEYLSRWLAPLPNIVAAVGVLACAACIYIYVMPRRNVSENGLIHIIRAFLGERKVGDAYTYTGSSVGGGAKLFLLLLVGVVILIFCGSAYAHAKHKDDGGWLVAWARSIQEDVAAIKADTGEIRNTTSRIEKKVAVLKRESSDDPRKELANMGVLWTRSAFNAALRAGDDRITGLFFQGGMRLESNGYEGQVGPLATILRSDNVKISQQFLANHPALNVADCTRKIEELPIELVLQASATQRSVMKHACGSSAVIKHLQLRLVHHEKRLRDQVATAERTIAARLSKDACLERLMVNGGAGLLNEAATFGPVEPAIGTISGKKRLLAEIHIQLATRRGPSVEELRKLVNQYCIEQASVAESAIDDSGLRRAKRLAAILSD